MVRSSLCGGWSGRSAEQLLGGLEVSLGHVDHAALLTVLLAAAGGRGRRERRTGLPTDLHPPQLPGPGLLEPLARAGVRLVLRHRSSSSSYVVWSRPGVGARP